MEVYMILHVAIDQFSDIFLFFYNKLTFKELMTVICWVPKHGSF